MIYKPRHRAILPRKLTKKSEIRIFFPSTPIIGQQDNQSFRNSVFQFRSQFKSGVKVLRRKHRDPVSSFLAGPSKERMAFMRRAMREGHWLLPAKGGTGMLDLVGRMTAADFKRIMKRLPIVSGFSDATSLLNYLYLKHKFMTFHYTNSWDFFATDNYHIFLEVLSGKLNSVTFRSRRFKWLSEEPKKQLEGIAIGGNMGTFNDLLGSVKIPIRSWLPYVLFLEEVCDDIEDLHNSIMILRNRGILHKVRALVLGGMSEETLPGHKKDSPVIFAQREKYSNKEIPYWLNDLLETRKRKGDPLHILKIDNFGHRIIKNTLILPIGAKTVITPDRRLTFNGPFVQ